MKIISNICLALFIAWGLIAIVDVWFDIVSTAVFYKLSVTLGLLLVIALGISLMLKNK